MNFLAHLLLSNNDDDIMIGNFIADSVRSVEWNRFKPDVVEGIKVHHKIDFFTDHHPLVEESKKRLRPSQGKYSPVVADIFYDHFLARNFHKYHKLSLEEFTQDAYALFHRRWDELPRAIQHMLPHMEEGNWLLNYANREGMENVFFGMSRRAGFKNNMARAVEDMYKDYDKYEADFVKFFPLLQGYINEEIARIPWK